MAGAAVVLPDDVDAVSAEQEDMMSSCDTMMGVDVLVKV